MIKRLAILLLVVAGSYALFQASRTYTSSILNKPRKAAKPANILWRMPEIEVRERALKRAKQLQEFAEARGFHTQYFLLVDMQIPSYQPRLFLFDALSQQTLLAALVTHGAGSERGDSALYFSNALGSYATSLGRYRIGEAYEGRFGYSYRLDGLDSTNSRARERAVVIHGYACVPEVIESGSEPAPLCMSLGCPAVAPAVLQKLRPYLDAPEKPILLDIYY